MRQIVTQFLFCRSRQRWGLSWKELAQMLFSSDSLNWRKGTCRAMQLTGCTNIKVHTRPLSKHTGHRYEVTVNISHWKVNGLTTKTHKMTVKRWGTKKEMQNDYKPIFLCYWEAASSDSPAKYYWKRFFYVIHSGCLSTVCRRGGGPLICLCPSDIVSSSTRAQVVCDCSVSILFFAQPMWCITADAAHSSPCLPVWWTVWQCPSNLGACRCVYSTSSARSRSCAESGLHYWKP